jgi:DNA polymerase-3 subunit epsilon
MAKQLAPIDWRTAPIFGFDIESTGVDPTTDRIVTACVVDAEGDLNWLVDPGIEIPEGASNVHGVTTERARAEGGDYAEGLRGIMDAIQERWAAGYVLIVFNAPYDLTMLQFQAQRVFGEDFPINGPVLDPLTMDKAIDPYRKGKRTLTAMSEHYGVTLDNAHEAKADAVAASRLAWKLRMHPSIANIGDIMLWQAAQYAKRQASFAQYLLRQGKDASDVNTEWPVRTA